jgi:hypothetical protein
MEAPNGKGVSDRLPVPEAEPAPAADPVDPLADPEAEAAEPAAAGGLGLTADEACAQAVAEGLTLVPAENETGFKGVRRDWIATNRPGSSKRRGAAGSRFRARFTAGGSRAEDLGAFDTAEEAALVYARRIGKDASMAQMMAQRSLTAEEAIAQAAAEGLTLVLGSSKTGYKGVCFDRDTANGKRRFVAHAHEHGRSKFLKLTDTPEEAALVYARYIGNTAARAAAAPPRRGMTSDEALAQAATEGLSLIVAQSVTGYRNVFATAEGRFTAKPKERGVWIHLGRFDTAQEAALVYARHMASQGVASGETLRGGAAVTAARNARATVAAAAEALEPAAIVGLGQLFMGPQSRVE